MNTTATIVTRADAPAGFPFSTAPYSAAAGYYRTAFDAAETAALNGITATVPVPEGYASLGLHQPVTSAGKVICGTCRKDLGIDTYGAYVAWWEANEYEGEPGHKPMTAEMYAYLEATCNGEGAAE